MSFHTVEYISIITLKMCYSPRDGDVTRVKTKTAKPWVVLSYGMKTTKTIKSTHRDYWTLNYSKRFLITQTFTTLSRVTDTLENIKFTRLAYIDGSRAVYRMSLNSRGSGGIVERWANTLFTASKRCQGSRVRNSSSPLLFSLLVDDYEFSLAPVHHEKEKSRGWSCERKNDRRLR